MAFNDQGNAFSVLMESIWEGGPVYDITLGKVELNNAEAMCELFFPEAWAKRESHLNDGEHAGWNVELDDGSAFFVNDGAVEINRSAPTLPSVIEIGELRPFDIELLLHGLTASGEGEGPLAKSLELQYHSLMGEDVSLLEVKEIGKRTLIAPAS